MVRSRRNRCLAAGAALLAALLLAAPAMGQILDFGSRPFSPIHPAQFEERARPEPPPMPAVPGRLPWDIEEQAFDEAHDDQPDLPSGLLGYPLHGRGPLSIEYIYTGEVFANLRGGTRREANYLGLFDLTLTTDLERLRFPAGGEFVILLQQVHGRGLSESGAVEDYQVLSNIDALPMTQVSEYYWQREWLDGNVFVRLGKQDANNDMAVVEVAEDFIHSSFGFHPTIPMPSYPEASAGAFAAIRWTDQWTFKVGVWDGDPQVGNWGFSGSGLAFSMVEVNYHYALGRNDRYPGRFVFGPWHHNEKPEEIDGERIFSQNYGYHFEWEQRLFYERPWDHEDEQGIIGFLQYAYAPGDRNFAHEYFGAGVVYRGLVPQRDDDLFGAGVAWLQFSERLTDLSPETAVEVFYKAFLSPYVFVQPDLQYIANPGGDGRDALVFGIRFELTL